MASGTQDTVLCAWKGHFPLQTLGEAAVPRRGKLTNLLVGLIQKNWSCAWDTKLPPRPWIFLADLNVHLGCKPPTGSTSPCSTSSTVTQAAQVTSVGTGPAVCSGVDKRVICGDPDDARISTSYVERQNLTMRMGMRRFTRLTNGLQEDLTHAVSLHYALQLFSGSAPLPQWPLRIPLDLGRHRWGFLIDLFYPRHCSLLGGQFPPDGRECFCSSDTEELVVRLGAAARINLGCKPPNLIERVLAPNPCSLGGRLPQTPSRGTSTFASV